MLCHCAGQISQIISPVPGAELYPEDHTRMGEIFGIICGVSLTVAALMYVGKSN
jgi:hypothetical protein